MSTNLSIAYLNGQYLPLERAQISVMDRGFMLGDGVYEVIPVYGGHIFRAQEHLTRLNNSLDAIRLANPYATDEWIAILNEIVRQNAYHSDQSLYLQVTRGIADKRDHAFPAQTHATTLVMSTALITPSDDYDQRGVRVITVEDIRWRRCDIKAITLLANILARQQAIDTHCAEAIFIRDGKAIEGAASNLFIVESNTIITPPNGPALLPGITRDLILELANKHGVAHQEKSISVAALMAADEVWLTSSTKELLPVTHIDGIAVAGGRPGPLGHAMSQYYQQYKQSLRRGIRNP